MSNLQIMVCLYLLPGLAIVASNFGRARRRLPHATVRAATIGITLAILTWPVGYYFANRKR